MGPAAEGVRPLWRPHPRCVARGAALRYGRPACAAGAAARASQTLTTTRLAGFSLARASTQTEPGATP
ncbi:MAG: hypothetical protein QOI71_892 [Gaiellales bacterium]|nr:hypothetical protein [Gaiellales bacterium]